jgi:hypothetical protein
MDDLADVRLASARTDDAEVLTFTAANGQSRPGQRPFGEAQHDFRCRVECGPIQDLLNVVGISGDLRARARGCAIRFTIAVRVIRVVMSSGATGDREGGDEGGDVEGAHDLLNLHGADIGASVERAL